MKSGVKPPHSKGTHARGTLLLGRINKPCRTTVINERADSLLVGVHPYAGADEVAVAKDIVDAPAFWSALA